jgi:hypothetical protein
MQQRPNFRIFCVLSGRNRTCLSRFVLKFLLTERIVWSILTANRAPSFNVGLAKKGTSLPMRFGRFCILLVFSLAFGLFCNEIPESLSLYDDTSNDFLVSSSASKIGTVQTARREPNLRRDAAPTAALATLPSLLSTYSTKPALPSGPDLLRLLSIQRK